MRKLISLLFMLVILAAMPIHTGLNPPVTDQGTELVIPLEEVTITYVAPEKTISPLTASVEQQFVFFEEVNPLIVNRDMYIPRNQYLLPFYLPTRIWQLPPEKRVLGGETDISWFT